MVDVNIYQSRHTTYVFMRERTEDFLKEATATLKIECERVNRYLKDIGAYVTGQDGSYMLDRSGSPKPMETIFGLLVRPKHQSPDGQERPVISLDDAKLYATCEGRDLSDYLSDNAVWFMGSALPDPTRTLGDGQPPKLRRGLSLGLFGILSVSEDESFYTSFPRENLLINPQVVINLIEQYGGVRLESK